MKILVLDDELPFLKTMHELLSRMEHEVDCVSNARDAVARIQRRS